jgi:hypothetical protein
MVPWVSSLPFSLLENAEGIKSWSCTYEVKIYGLVWEMRRARSIYHSSALLLLPPFSAFGPLFRFLITRHYGIRAFQTSSFPTRKPRQVIVHDYALLDSSFTVLFQNRIEEQYMFHLLSKTSSSHKFPSTLWTVQKYKRRHPWASSLFLFLENTESIETWSSNPEVKAYQGLVSNAGWVGAIYSTSFFPRLLLPPTFIAQTLCSKNPRLVSWWPACLPNPFFPIKV